MKRLLGCSVLVLTTVFAAPLHAMPDEIRIVRGTLVQATDLTADLNVEGTFGTRIDAALFFQYAFVGWFLCDDFHPCLPGDVISLRAAYGTHPPILTGSGQAVIQGQTYSLFDDASAALDFDGAFVLPEVTATVTGTVELSAPFAFSGSLQVPNRHRSDTHDVFELRGSGLATITLVRHSFLPGWIVASVRYDFVPRGGVIL